MNGRLNTVAPLNPCLAIAVSSVRQLKAESRKPGGRLQHSHPRRLDRFAERDDKVLEYSGANVGIVAFFVTLLIAAGISPVAVHATAPPFVVTFWCAPPLGEMDARRMDEIAAAGFNVVGPPCEGRMDSELNRKALDLAARHGLGVWVRDPRFAPSVLKGPGWKETIGRAVADYLDHPALAGYFVDDEPVAGEFPKLSRIVGRLRELDPHHLAYINLLPDFIPAKNLGTSSYDAYLERFLVEVEPALLSYDYYPFGLKKGKKKDRSTYFANLTAIRNAALRHDVPFMVIVLAMPHGPYRDPTEAELAWQVFHALAFGARGVSYFTYWTPPRGGKWNNRYGLIENGRRTLHYYQVARLNHLLSMLAAQLAASKSLAVADSEGEIGSSFPIGPIEAIEGGPITAGLFGGPNGELSVLLVNRDYEYGVTASLRLRSDALPPEVFDTESCRWRESKPSFLLPPGGARLMRWP